MMAKRLQPALRGRAVFLTAQRPQHAGSSLRSRAVEDENQDFTCDGGDDGNCPHSQWTARTHSIIGEAAADS